jgi:hypothetical protein
MKARQFLLIVGGAFMLAGCTTTPSAASWEYRTRATDNPKGKFVLDEYGQSNWELVSNTAVPIDQSGTNFQYQYIFKWPKK